MNLLEQRILEDGIVKEGDILMVDSFLNHRMDIELIDEVSNEIYKHFQNHKVTKILTIEASGIAFAVLVAKRFGVPIVFAKKKPGANVGNDVYKAKVHSYTHNNDYQATIAKRYLNENDHIIIVDDFLANGAASQGLIDICKQANASVEGIGIAVEKAYQHDDYLGTNYDLFSVAVIESMDDNNIKFRD